MNMQSSSVIAAKESLAKENSIQGNLLRCNAAMWLGGLALSLALALPPAIRYEKSNGLTVHDGRLALDFEHFITRKHPYRLPSLNAWTALELALFRNGKPGLVVGENDWLFTTEEFPLPSISRHQLRKNVEKMQATVADLERKGIRTVILPIPTKAELYEAQVPPALRPHMLRMASISRELEAHGLEWIALDTPLRTAQEEGQQVFFRTETHWTPEGARLAARTTARWIRHHYRNPLPSRDFSATPGNTKKLEGDLSSYLPLAPLFSSQLPAGEHYLSWQFSRRSLSQDEEDLFSDTASRIAVIGTSYSADERWNYPGWLRTELGTDIDNISEKGKGPFASMESFRQRVEAGQTGVRLVIWEIPVRTLAMDLSGAAGRTRQPQP